MNAFNRLLSTAAIGFAVGLSSIAAHAETPANMLVIPAGLTISPQLILHKALNLRVLT